MEQQSSRIQEVKQEFAPPEFQLPPSATTSSTSNTTTTSTNDAISPIEQATTSKLCAVCNDRASGKHYGVYSCEGCKGFFKRTVRKNLNYACRDDRQCTIDKRQRNRCQYCRYQKCVKAGMKKEAVQDERLKRPPNEDEFANPLDEMPVMDILEAEKEYNNNQQHYNQSFHYCHVNWAARIPHFKKLGFNDQKILIRTAYTELYILNLAFHRSKTTDEQVKLDKDMLDRLERFLNSDVMDKIHEIKLDDTEIGSLKAIILLNPDSRGLHYPEQVLAIREKLYASLEAYCKTTFPDKKGRFARILLRLPALRSIGLEAEIECAVDAAPIDKIPDHHLKRLLAGSGDTAGSSPSGSLDANDSFVFNNTDSTHQQIMPPPSQPPQGTSSAASAQLEPLLSNGFTSSSQSVSAQSPQMFTSSMLNHESFLK